MRRLFVHRLRTQEMELLTLQEHGGEEKQVLYLNKRGLGNKRLSFAVWVLIELHLNSAVVYSY